MVGGVNKREVGLEGNGSESSGGGVKVKVYDNDTVITPYIFGNPFKANANENDNIKRNEKLRLLILKMKTKKGRKKE